MAALNLNTIRKTIEKRILDELNDVSPIKFDFDNQPFDASTTDTFVQCQTSFGGGRYLANGVNIIVGLLTINIFTKEGIGSGTNFTIGKRLRDLYNKVTVSDVIFDSPVGPEVLTSSPEGKFQTQLRITFEIYEEL